MILKVISPERVIFKGEVSSVSLPGKIGKFMVLKNHAPLVSVLTPGEILYRDIDREDNKSISVAGGIVEVSNNEITVCVI